MVDPKSTTDAAAGSAPRARSWIVGCAALALFWIAVCAVFALQISAVGLLPWSDAFILSLLDWGPWIVFGPFVLWLAARMPLGPKTWRWALPAHLLACLLVVALTEVTMSALSLRRELLVSPPDGFRREPPPGDGRRRPPPDHFASVRFSDRARIAVPVYWLLVAVMQALAQQRRVAERERRALQAEAHLAEARLAALQAQLNPHFLFNTLNTIAELVYANPAAAEATITSLSELLRAALAAQQRREVSLDEELRFVERYCAIQRARFADRLEVHYDIAPATRGAAVPTLLFQPLVENAIIHGVAPGRAPGKVFIRARAVGDRLELEVADTGHPGSTAAEVPFRFREGVGLANSRARLVALYGERQRFSLGRAAEGGVAARVEIPLRPLVRS